MPKPAEVKVYKLAEGHEQRKLSQASSITLTKGAVHSYLDLSPTPQNYDVATLEKSIDKTLEENNHVASLRRKLERDPEEPRWIKTVHGVGYKLDQ